MQNTTITAIDGLLAGHASDFANRTGCTAILCPAGFTPGFALPGFAPGTRETDLLRPESTVDEIHGLCLAGGSAFGLAAAEGVVRYLREQGHGLVMPQAVIPLVPGAVIYDLDMNRRPGLLPDTAMGYAAAQAAQVPQAAMAASAAPLEQGSVGAGCGARCGRLYSRPDLPEERSPSSKAGLGSYLVERQGVKVGALVVLNALGDIYDPADGSWVAGGRDEQGRALGREAALACLAGENLPRGNTVLCVVATNVPLSKVQASRLARMAGSGLARCIRPAHLTYDGDVVFALAAKTPLPSEAGPWTESLLGAMGADAVAQAVLNAARLA